MSQEPVLDTAETLPLLHCASAPHVAVAGSVERLMRLTVFALLPVAVASIAFFGLRALALILLSTATTVGIEWWIGSAAYGRKRLTDLSPLITGLLFAFTLPPGLPLWIAPIGAAFGILVGKWAFGGLGNTIVNPALLGRLFVSISFPWAFSSYLPTNFHSLSGTGGFGLDALATATPLATVRHLCTMGSVHGITWSHWFLDLSMGNFGGAIGATASVVILGSGLFLMIKRVIPISTPLVLIATVAFLTWLTVHGFGFGTLARLNLTGVGLLSGGLLLASVFMVTDPATSPATLQGRVLFAFGCGALIVIFRLFSSRTEGIAVAILFMNILVPLIDHLTIPRPFGKRTRHD